MVFLIPVILQATAEPPAVVVGHSLLVFQAHVLVEAVAPAYSLNWHLGAGDTSHSAPHWAVSNLPMMPINQDLVVRCSTISVYSASAAY